MASVFITCVVIAILIFIFFMIFKQDSQFKNCLTNDYTFIDVQHVSIDDECPSRAKTCPRYDGCDNNNIPFCRNRDENGNYESISCPTCENGKWKCDFFMMGNSLNGIGSPKNSTEQLCSGNTGKDRRNCQFNYCESVGGDCKWGGFNTGNGRGDNQGAVRYTDIGAVSPGTVSGYKVSSSGDPIFNLSYGYDATDNFGGNVETIDGVTLDECIGKAKQSYPHHFEKDGLSKTINFDGSYGLVYDIANSSCDLHKIGDGVSWQWGTAKLVKGE